MTDSLTGRQVTVVGLGRFGGGVGVTRWLCGLGADVTVSDAASADDLAEPLADLEGLPVTLHLGEHVESDFTEADLPAYGRSAALHALRPQPRQPLWKQPQNHKHLLGRR